MLLNHRLITVKRQSWGILLLQNSFRFNKLTSGFPWVCPVIDHEFCHNIVKVAVDPQGDSRVDPQTTLTML